jgi:hypothetical protein
MLRRLEVGNEAEYVDHEDEEDLLRPSRNAYRHWSSRQDPRIRYITQSDYTRSSTIMNPPPSLSKTYDIQQSPLKYNV